MRFQNQLSQSAGEALLTQINNLDMSKIDLWVHKYIKNEHNEHLPENFQAADYYPATPKDDKTAKKFDKAKQLGKKLISTGKVGAFVVAGGQGTRLGYDGPKGNYAISPIKNKSLFQIFAEMIKEVSKRYSTVCPWYIMTSPLNDAATREIFEQNNYFGLKKEDVFLFQQGTNPNFDFQGRILLA
ncbi:MAG TPA: UTP--glucose-1-phosphate uridylyltransferase, partial [Sedimentisphaerales bacterium]|nr:UTP--glucose-1-phosphate uridylyltransferase [Sedimentisphaerales bacterium]